MGESDKTREELLEELQALKQKLAGYQSLKAKYVAIETQLNDTQQKLNEAQQLARIGNWEWKFDEQTLTWSDEVYRIFGVEPHSFTPSVESYESAIHPEDLQPLTQKREQMLKETQSSVIDHRIVLPDGEIRYVQERTQLIRDSQDKIIRMIGTVQDITERKKMEAILRQSETHYKLLAENTQDIITCHDGNMKTLYISPAVERMLGYTPVEFQTIPVMDLVHPDDFGSLSESMATNKQTLGKYQFRYRHKDGHYIWVESVSNRIYDEAGNLTQATVSTRDISERKQTEEQLIASEARWRSLVGNIPNVVFEFDLDGIIQYINFSVIDETTNDIIGRSLFDFSLPENHDMVRDYIDRVIQTGEPVQYETRGIDKHWYSVHVGAIKQDDRVIRLLMILTDITQLKQTEQRLIASEARWRSLVDNIPSILVEFDKTGTIQYINYSAISLSPEEVIGTNAFDFLLPDDRERIQKHLAYVSETGETVADEIQGMTSGEWYSVRIGSIKEDGQVVKLLAILSNISNIKRSEIALRESEDKYRKLVELSPDSIGVHMDGKIVYVNPACVKLLGASDAEELLGMSVMDIVHPDYHNIARKRIQAAQDRNEYAPMFEEKLVRLDGKVIDVELMGIPIIYGGKPAVQNVFRDISKRKQEQEQQLQLQLERERIQILSKFITNASHEFRTPLATINTSAYLQSKSDDPAKKEQLLHKIEEQTRLISLLVDALNTMSELDSVDELPLMEQNLCEILTEVHNAKQAQFESKNQHCVLNMDVDPLMVRVHTAYLERALKAIMSNAIRFTPEGGTIQIRTAAVDHRAILEISDNGIGIHEDEIPHIFERFYRGDDSGTMSGFGLGLAITRRIIELHQGTIEVESTANQGTTIRILLPLND